MSGNKHNQYCGFQVQFLPNLTFQKLSTVSKTKIIIQNLRFHPDKTIRKCGSCPCLFDCHGTLLRLWWSKTQILAASLRSCSGAPLPKMDPVKTKWFKLQMFKILKIRTINFEKYMQKCNLNVLVLT